MRLFLYSMLFLAPLLHAEMLQLDIVYTANSNAVELGWEGEVGGGYEVLVSSNLFDWSSLSGPLVGTGVREVIQIPPSLENKRYYVLRSRLRWFKGNTHAHSLWSDGNDFAENILSWYKTNGFHFATLSDHNILSDHEKWILESKAGPAIPRAETLYGTNWVVRRVNGGKDEVRLRRIDEFRPLLESTGDFLILQSEEISASYFDPLRQRRVPLHLNAVNVQTNILPINAGPSLRDVMRMNLKSISDQEAATGKPILAHFNHPNFHYSFGGEDLGHVVEERFVEVYNGHPSINHNGDADHPSDEQIWDIANAIRVGQLNTQILFGVSTDDSHHYFPGTGDSTLGRGYVVVRSTRLNPASLIAAMRAGDFYASTGVDLEEMSFDPVARIMQITVAGPDDVTAEWIGTRTGGLPGEVFATEVGRTFTFVVPADAMYARIALTSTTPHPNPSFVGQVERAWTQPVGN